MHGHPWLHDHPWLPCCDVSNTALYEVRSKVNTADLIAIASDRYPFLPAARQTHSLDWELDMADDGLLVTFLVSHLNARHLSAVLDLDVEEVCFVPFGIPPTTLTDR